MYRVLISDSLPESVLAHYQKGDGFAIEYRPGITAAELIQAIGDFDALVVRSRTQVTGEALAKAPRLKVIGRAGAGVDNIDVHEATRRGIIVMNTPGANTIAATEHTIALMLSALRNIPPAYLSLRAGKWDRKSFMGRELFEKTVGIIGLGKIGREVAKRLSAFGVELLGYDPILTSDLADRLGLELVPFEELLRRSDIITLHAPRLPETLNMINASNLQLCKDGVIIVNCARGGLVHEEDLLKALNSGKVGAAAFDVFEKEPPENRELINHPHFIGTPHLGASTAEAQLKVAEQILNQIVEFFNKKVARNAVNFVSVDENLQPVIEPYFQLAWKLGILFSQLRDSRVKAATLRFFGSVSELPVEPIASHLMAGALRSHDQSDSIRDVDLINPINAIAVAREKGIEIEIGKKDHPPTNYTNMITCDFETDTGTIHLGGTVYAPGVFRLVKLDEFNVDAELAGKMVFIFNEDVPGIIGKAGTILGDNRINIGHLSSGRNKEKKIACNIFNVEGKWNKPVLQAQLQQVSQIQRVVFVEIPES